MSDLLWKPSAQRKKSSNLSEFLKFIKFDKTNNFKDIWNWSISNPELFWSKFWDYSEIIGNKGKEIIKKNEVFHKTKILS